MIWTIPAISFKTCGSGMWTICSMCADKRAPVGTITQHQRSRPRLAEVTAGREPKSQNNPTNTAIPSCVKNTDEEYLKGCAVLGSAWPVFLVPLPSCVGGNLTATRRCGSTTPANPSDGRSGHCTPPAPRQHPGNKHGKTTEERREGESRQQKDGPDAPEGAGT